VCVARRFELGELYLQKVLRRIGSVGGQLLQFKLFGYVACSGVHRRFGLELRNIAVLVEGWVQATSDVNRVLDARRIRLVRAVRHHVRDDRGSEGLRMDVRGQVLERLVETGAFAPLVTRSEDVLRDGIALIIVNDSLAVESVVAYMHLVDDVVRELEVRMAHEGFLLRKECG